MSAMLAITKHGVCVGIISPCLVNFIMADMEVVQNCISAECAYQIRKDIVLLLGPKHAPCI